MSKLLPRCAAALASHLGLRPSSEPVMGTDGCQDKRAAQLCVKCVRVDCVNDLQKSDPDFKKLFDAATTSKTMPVYNAATTLAFAVIVALLLVVAVQSKATLQLEADTSSSSTSTTATTTATSTEATPTSKTENKRLTEDQVRQSENEFPIKVEKPNTVEQNQSPGNGDDRDGDQESPQKLEFDKSVFAGLYSRGKTKSVEEIVDHSVDQSPKDDENLIEHRQGRSNVFRKGRQDEVTPAASGRTSEDILNEIVNFGLDQSKFLFDVQEKRIYDNGLSVKKSDPAHFVGVFNRQSQRAKDLSRYGYATLQASSLLSKQ